MHDNDRPRADPANCVVGLPASKPTYVFCLLDHKDKGTVDSLDKKQWRFYVLASRVLDNKVSDQKGIALSNLLALDSINARFDTLLDAGNKAHES